MATKLTKKEAVWLYKEGKWKHWSDAQIVNFQLYQEKLCMDWAPFHAAMESMLNRPVWSCEFAFPLMLQKEYEKRCRRLAYASTAVMLLIFMLATLS